MRNTQPTIRKRLLVVLLPAIALLSTALGALIYDRLYQAILTRFETKLVTVSGLVGAFVDPNDHDWLMEETRKPGFDGPRTENSMIYRRQIDPMRRVRRELGLTYLYTQAVGGPEDVYYILDATEGEEHTTVGYADSMPADTLAGLRKLSTLGSMYVSPIQFQEDWGLLKTAAAPVFSRTGAVSSSAGADVNIGAIREYTENALLVSGLVGALGLLVGTIAASFVVSRVSRPLSVVRANALTLAAGKTTLRPLGRASAEVARLGCALERVSAMAAEFSGIKRAALDRLEKERIRDLLCGTLDRSSSPAQADRRRQIETPGHLLVAISRETDPVDLALWQLSVDHIERAPPDAVRDLVELGSGRFLLIDKQSLWAEAFGGAFRLRPEVGAMEAVATPGRLCHLQPLAYRAALGDGAGAPAEELQIDLRKLAV